MATLVRFYRNHDLTLEAAACLGGLGAVALFLLFLKLNYGGL